MVTFNPTVISMAFPPEPLVQIQNNFTELFLMMPSISSPSSKNMWMFCLECVILQTSSELICRCRMHSPEINLKHFYLLLLLLLLLSVFLLIKAVKKLLQGQWQFDCHQIRCKCTLMFICTRFGGRAFHSLIS